MVVKELVSTGSIFHKQSQYVALTSSIFFVEQQKKHLPIECSLPNSNLLRNAWPLVYLFINLNGSRKCYTVHASRMRLVIMYSFLTVTPWTDV